VQAAALSVSDTNFDTAYAALNTLLNTTYAVFANMSATTTIVRATWDTAWKNYYNQRTLLLNAIAAKAATLATWSYVSGANKPDDNATDNSTWSAAGDVTKIDGGELYVGSHLVLSEGGSAIFGDNNVIIDTQGSHGNIVVSEDGGPATHSYCELSDGDINFQYWDAAQGRHYRYKSLVRIEVGTANNGTAINIPGVFKSNPQIMISPNNMTSYDASYAGQSQKLVFNIDSLVEINPGHWQFTPKAMLELSDGSASTPLNLSYDHNSNSRNAYSNYQTPSIDTGFPTVKQLVVRVAASAYSTYFSVTTGGPGDALYYYKTDNDKFRLILYCYSNGEWIPTYSSYSIGSMSHTFTTPVMDHPITYFVVKMECTASTYLASSTQISSPGDASATYQNITLIDSSSNLSGFSQLAGGTINWIAIGQ